MLIQSCSLGDEELDKLDFTAEVDGYAKRGIIPRGLLVDIYPRLEELFNLICVTAFGGGLDVSELGTVLVIEAIWCPRRSMGAEPIGRLK